MIGQFGGIQKKKKKSIGIHLNIFIMKYKNKKPLF